MSNESKRLFFAVNLPLDVRHYIAESILPLVPGKGWKKVPQENLHVTMHFLGSVPEGKMAGLEEQAKGLQGFGEFEAEINCAGHFGENVLWLGFGKGNEEFNALNRELQQATGIHDPEFHAHITVARNKGAEKGQAAVIAEKIGKKIRAMEIPAKSVELMESALGKNGQEYHGLFSVRLGQAKPQSF